MRSTRPEDRHGFGVRGRAGHAAPYIVALTCGVAGMALIESHSAPEPVSPVVDAPTPHPTAAGLPNVTVSDLVYVPERGALYAGTHGQGVWQLRVQ